MKFKDIINESKPMDNVVGFYEIDKTAMSVQMRLLDVFPNIKTDRKANNGMNPGFPIEKYPFVVIVSNPQKFDMKAVKEENSKHYAKFLHDKNYRAKYDLSKSYYRSGKF
jgi:hypothetical protein